jgi:hypothetical protein
MKASESDKAGASKSAQDTAPGQKSKGMSSDNDAAKGGKDMKAEGRDSKSGTNTNAAETRDKAGSTTQSNQNALTKSSTDTNRAQTNTTTDRSQTTTGNAATSATAAPPAEKRTQITSAIRSEKVEDGGSRVNVNVAVGTTLPASVTFHPLPSRIVEIYPEWRGYDFVLVHGRYVIVRPQTREIVYIIEG